MFRLLVGIILLSTLIGPLMAQDGGGAPAGPTLLKDIELLKRLVPLNLTDAQLDALLAAYAAKPAEEQPDIFNEQTLSQL